MKFTHFYIHICGCGDAHPVRWNSNAGIDGAYIANCPERGLITLSGCKGERPGGTRELSEAKHCNALA